MHAGAQKITLPISVSKSHSLSNVRCTPDEALESMGLRTGIDLDQLLAIREIVSEGIPGEPLYGYVPDAGVTKGFVPASKP